MNERVVQDGEKYRHDAGPSNNVVTPLLTDLYQVSMAYAYWKSGRHKIPSTFDMYYRKAPFDGSFVVFAGLDECIRFLASFRFDRGHIDYISKLLPHSEPAFLLWLEDLDCSQVCVSAQKEGAIAFPNVPLMKVSGPLGVVQLLETTLLNLVNYASLVATNAYRFRRTVGPQALLFEFGLRRAQGPDGALSASKYCYLGGFDGTSNVAAGYKFGIPVKGTHAHSFVQSFQEIEEVRTMNCSLPLADGSLLPIQKFVDRVVEIRKSLFPGHSTSDGELSAFITYAAVYPSAFSGLVDTYSTLKSGVPNFMCVALALSEYGYAAVGIRLDSGDLADLSVRVHRLFHSITRDYERKCAPQTDHHKKMANGLSIMVSNNVTAQLLEDIYSRDHKINAFGIGTHLVTCREHPALGCVFKLSSIAASPRMKFSEDRQKSSIPGDKAAFRLYKEDGYASFDVLTLCSEEPPRSGKSQSFRSHRNPDRIVTVTPKRVERLLHMVWDGKESIDVYPPLVYLQSARQTLKKHAAYFRQHNTAFAKGKVGFEILMSLKLFETVTETMELVWKTEFQGTTRE